MHHPKIYFKFNLFTNLQDYNDTKCTQTNVGAGNMRLRRFEEERI